MKLKKSLFVVHVKAVVCNLKTGKSRTVVMVVPQNGFLTLKDQVKQHGDINRNEMVEHMEVI